MGLALSLLGTLNVVAGESARPIAEQNDAARDRQELLSFYTHELPLRALHYGGAACLGIITPGGPLIALGSAMAYSCIAGACVTQYKKSHARHALEVKKSEENKN